MSESDVTVVTVTYNGIALVRRCLASLVAQELGDVMMDVLVVDNASTDGTTAILAHEHPEVRVLRNERNLGFAGGNQRAFELVKTPFVVLLNNDAQARPDAVRLLVEAMRAAPEHVAAMSATVLLAARFRAAEPDETPEIRGADGSWIADPRGEVRLINSTGNLVRRDGFGVDRGWLCDAAHHRPTGDPFGFSGAAAVLRMSALHEVGGFDERFFMYYEDTDLSWRLRRAGRIVQHCPEAVVEHEHAASSREGSAFFVYHDARNRLATLTKNASAPMVARALWWHLRSIAATVRDRRLHRATTLAHAGLGWVGMLAHLLRARREISRHAQVSRAQVERMLTDPGPHAEGSYRSST